MRTIIALFILLAPAALWAQDDLPEAGEATGDLDGSDEATAPAVTEYDFEPDEVEGEMVKPDELRVHVREGHKTSSLIDVRSDFVDECVKSVEDI